MDEIRLLATCTLGLGFSQAGFKAGLELRPHAIACDAGSSDFGPYYLGTGEIQKARRTLRRDLELLIGGARSLDIPFMTGSAGGAGAAPQVDGMAQLVREIAQARGLAFRLATIKSDIAVDWLRDKLRAGRVQSAEGLPPLDEASLASTVRAVAMAGAEPFMRALDQGADIIIAGRATDPAIFAGVPLRAGIPADIAWHAAKSIDKGYLATTNPQDGSPVLARLRKDHFILEPTRQGSRCSTASVAALTLHENPDPFQVAQPTGTIDTSAAQYEQVDARCVRVTGSRYIPHAPSLKIEGAERVGYRTILLAGLRDPRLIARMDEFLDAFRALLVRAAASMGIAEGDYTVQFRVYGRDAVMGRLEPTPDLIGHELGLICDVVGRTEEIAAAVGSRLGPTGSRLDITGKLGGGGNFAYPFSPSLIKMGPVFRWNIWHIVDVEARELTELFKLTIEQVDGRPA